MALSSETSKTVFNCTGGTTYDFDFKVFEAADLEVIRVTALGVESTLALTTGYSVSALTETGGRVTTVSTYSDGNLIVRRKQSKKQEIDYTQNDTLSTPVLEEQLDKTVMMIQEVKEQVERCIQMPAITEEADVPDYAELIDTATVAAQDAADNASDSADAAGVSAAAAAVSAGAATTNGAAQVALATAQVVLATTQADNAATSAEEAAASAAAAVEIVGGTIKASQAEAEAATDDLKYMTPLQVKNEVQKSGAVLIPAANVVLTGKQDALGYTPENVANKDTDGTLAANSDTKYPSQKAVKTYADTKVISPATNTADKVPQWDGANSKTLKDGLTVGTSANNLVQLDANAKLPAVDGSQLTGLNIPAEYSPDYTAGNLLVASANTERNVTSNDYSKVKEIVAGRSGTLRICFDLKTTVGVRTAYGYIYRNGSPVGTEQNTSSTSYVTKSQDISGWTVGDLVQLYYKSKDDGTVYAKNFQIKVATSDVCQINTD